MTASSTQPSTDSKTTQSLSTTLKLTATLTVQDKREQALRLLKSTHTEFLKQLKAEQKLEDEKKLKEDKASTSNTKKHHTPVDDNKTMISQFLNKISDNKNGKINRSYEALNNAFNHAIQHIHINTSHLDVYHLCGLELMIHFLNKYLEEYKQAFTIARKKTDPDDQTYEFVNFYAYNQDYCEALCQVQKIMDDQTSLKDRETTYEKFCKSTTGGLPDTFNRSDLIQYLPLGSAAKFIEQESVKIKKYDYYDDADQRYMESNYAENFWVPKKIIRSSITAEADHLETLLRTELEGPIKFTYFPQRAKSQETSDYYKKFIPEKIAEIEEKIQDRMDAAIRDREDKFSAHASANQFRIQEREKLEKQLQKGYQEIICIDPSPNYPLDEHLKLIKLIYPTICKDDLEHKSYLFSLACIKYNIQTRNTWRDFTKFARDPKKPDPREQFMLDCLKSYMRKNNKFPKWIDKAIADIYPELNGREQVIKVEYFREMSGTFYPRLQLHRLWNTPGSPYYYVPPETVTTPQQPVADAKVIPKIK